jgi:outer membrane immunogenic protein
MLPCKCNLNCLPLGIVMKKLLQGSAALLVLATAGSAMAANLAVKAPVYKAPVMAPAYDWTGFYVGAELGAKWANSAWTATSLQDAFPPGLVKTIDASSPRDYSLFGGRFGINAGYNVKYKMWVYGIEADIAWTDVTSTQAGFPGLLLFPGPGADLTSVRMRWDASVRGRLGFLVAPEFLLYATGGVAWQNIETAGTCQNSVSDPLCVFSGPGAAPFLSQTNGVTRVGWTIGGGLEWKVYGSWLMRGEYRYSDFGTQSDVFFPGQPTLFFGAPARFPGVDTYRDTLRLRTSIATFGVAYKFDWAGPVVAKY